MRWERKRFRVRKSERYHVFLLKPNDKNVHR